MTVRDGSRRLNAMQAAKLLARLAPTKPGYDLCAMELAVMYALASAVGRSVKSVAIEIDIPDGLTKNELVQSLSISHSTGLDVLRALEARSYVETHVDPADRRRHVSRLTPFGHTALRSARRPPEMPTPVDFGPTPQS